MGRCLYSAFENLIEIQKLDEYGTLHTNFKL